MCASQSFAELSVGDGKCIAAANTLPALPSDDTGKCLAILQSDINYRLFRDCTD